MARYIAFDVETPNQQNDRMSAIGITVVEDGEVTEHFFSLVNPEASFDYFNTQLTGISADMVRNAPTFPELWEKIRPYFDSGILAAHNAVFDLGVLKKCLGDYGIFWKTTVSYLCTVQIGRSLLPGRGHKLNEMCDYYQIPLNHHQADSDSEACARILLHYLEQEGDLRRFVRFYRLSSAKAAASPEKGKDSGPAGEPRPMEKAQGLLRDLYGYQDFRQGQETAIGSLLGGRDVLGIMPTGSGKSLCYQIPAMMLDGITLVISPLISLMKDQVAALRSRGIPAACLNSALEDEEYSAAARGAARGEFRLLYVAPERLRAPGFLRLCSQIKVAFVAVDEAHCISQWGQDFRPSYLQIPDFIAQLPDRPLLGAFTATATPRVRRDILENLQLRDPVCVSTGFDRPNLSFSVYQPENRDQALLGLLRDRFRQSGIVYCATRKAVESVCNLLISEGFPAVRYHAGLDPEERARNQEDFLFDRKRVMVATNAFGMGIDKSNVSYVIHYNMPKSLEAYYQEAGRAGRDGCDADCILLYAGQDVVTARWLIEHGDPNPNLTPAQQEEVREKDEERLKRMAFYAKSRRCLRRELLRYFGEDAPENCGNCSNCVPDCEHADITTEAQMILSCVARTGQRLSWEDISELMRGVVPDPAPAGVDPAALTTFGLMRETGAEQLSGIIRALFDQGIMDRLEGDPRVPVLNLSSRQVLFEHRRVTMRRIAPARIEKAAPQAEDLFQALQQLRYEISAKEYIAASVLFPDVTLRDICRVLPRDIPALSRIDGMGIYKANRYGKRILELVGKYSK